MNKVKYQIFVSSTYEDLKEERDQVIKACLEMGHIPVGMEMFSAADEEQWKMITRQIDESDYYIIITANRYGSMVKGVSYTEKEYNYAVAKGVPVLGFILDSKAPWPGNRAEEGEEARKKLRAFRKKIRLKPVNFWTNKDDLHGKCAVALTKAFNTQSRPGWIRSPDAVGPEVASELSRLSSLNAKLMDEIAELRKAADTSGFSQGDDVLILKFGINRSTTLVATIKTTWNEVFIIVAKRLLEKPHEYEAKAAINQHFAREAVTQYKEKYEPGTPVTDDEVRFLGAFIVKDDFDLVRIQLMALKLVQVEQYQIEDDTYIRWVLTQQGRELYASTLAKRKN